MAAISIDGTPMTALPSDADQINYNNTSSGLSATEVQDAIDELVLEKKDEYETITYAQWQAMTPAQQAAKDYYISNYPSSQIIAGNVSYSNTSSGMSANNVQGAVDELASEKKDEYTPITYAQWSALTPTQKAAKDYYISDYPSSAITAGNVSYNNSSSGMAANNMQSAIDELKSELTVDVLLEPTLATETATVHQLAGDIRNYKLLLVTLGASIHRTQGSNVIVVANINQYYNVSYQTIDTRLTFSTTTSITIDGQWYVAVYGILK